MNAVQTRIMANLLAKANTSVEAQNLFDTWFAIFQRHTKLSSNALMTAIKKAA